MPECEAERFVPFIGRGFASRLHLALQPLTGFDISIVFRLRFKVTELDRCLYVLVCWYKVFTRVALPTLAS